MLEILIRLWAVCVVLRVVLLASVTAVQALSARLRNRGPAEQQEHQPLPR